MSSLVAADVGGWVVGGLVTSGVGGWLMSPVVTAVGGCRVARLFYVDAEGWDGGLVIMLHNMNLNWIRK